MVLSVEERERFLAEPLVAVLSVAAGSERGPVTAPVWYAYRPGGDVVLFTGRTSRKARLIERTGRFTLTVQSTSPTYRYAAVEGPAAFVEVTPELVREVASRYLPAAKVAQYADDALARGEELIAVRMRPERWNAADLGPSR
ncbi:pyridoxamine 5'-phosphate oxidase family protein [Streptomyces piniterrae]|uniref:Pyridoxamine 5'-phosphate oxidase family protein n=1 Tax=Streptomyces piniterrae TaxID=2571125 RepID=A0A4U0NE95_9ACTN|nr:pyridoxamine 5'-phosphate oxidase family protein [Streptomyces piniterrae]TJZ52173.1 pyridoxamine 5'-phosphate oxidase family protein [Streptomyces piniterrae]